VNKDY